MLNNVQRVRLAASPALHIEPVSERDREALEAEPAPESRNENDPPPVLDGAFTAEHFYIGDDPKRCALPECGLPTADPIHLERQTRTVGVECGDAVPNDGLVRRAPTAAESFPRWHQQLANRTEAPAIPTGFRELDALLAAGGWRPGLTLIGAAPGVGKSAGVLQSGVYAANLGHPVLYLSLEMSEDVLFGRLACHLLGLSMDGYWNKSPEFVEASLRVPEHVRLDCLRFACDTAAGGAGTAGVLRQLTEQVIEETSCRPLVIVDYLQLMRPPPADRAHEKWLQVSEAGEALHKIAREFDVPVLAVAAIRRDSYYRLPSLDSFKGSGDLECYADACLFLHQPNVEDKPGPVELHVRKNRYGPETAEEKPIRLEFDREHGRFREAGSPARRMHAV